MLLPPAEQMPKVDVAITPDGEASATAQQENKTEKIDLGGEKTQSMPAAQKPGFLERAKNALKNTVGSKEFWFKERQAISNQDDDSKAMRVTKNVMRAGGVLGKAAFDMAASVTGAKVLFDLPLHLLQSSEVKNNRAEALKILTGQGKFEEKQLQIKALLEQASMAKKLSPQELVAFNAALEGVDKGWQPVAEAKYTQVLDSYMQAKTSGMQVVRQGVNTLFMVTGTQVLRAGATLTLKGLEAFAASKQDATRDKIAGGEKGAGEIFKSKFKEGLLKTVTLGMASSEQNRSGMKKFADAAQALGTIGTFLGIGSAAYQEASHGSVSGHIQEAFSKLQSGEFGEFAGHNVETNANRMADLYLNGGIAKQFGAMFTQIKGGVGGAIDHWFGSGAPKAEAIRQAAAVAHHDYASDAGKAIGAGILSANEKVVSAVDQAKNAAGKFMVAAATEAFNPDKQVGPPLSAASPEAQFGQASRTVEFEEPEVVAVDRADIEPTQTVTFDEEEAGVIRPAPIARPSIKLDTAVRAIDDGEITPEGRRKTTKVLEAAANKLDAIGEQRAAVKTEVAKASATIDTALADLKQPMPKSELAQQLAAAEDGVKHTAQESTAIVRPIDEGELSAVDKKKITRVLEQQAKQLDKIGEQRAAVKAEVAKASAAIDQALVELKQPAPKSELAQQLAAAEDNAAKSVGKSALRLKMEAAAAKSRELEAVVTEEKPVAPAETAADTRRAEIVAKVKAEVDKAMGPVDKVIADIQQPVAKTELTEQLAAAEETASVKAGKSALRLKMEAAAAQARELETEDVVEKPAAAEPAINKETAGNEFAKLDRQLEEMRATKPKTRLAEQLAAAEDQKVVVDKQAALRAKMDAADAAGRQLQPPDQQEVVRSKSFVSGMKKALEGSAKAVDTAVARGEIQDTLNKDLGKYGLRVVQGRSGETIDFKPSKGIKKLLEANPVLSRNHPFAKAGIGSATFDKMPNNTLLDMKGESMMTSAYQIGVLEREAQSLPNGAAKEAVLAMKKSLQEDLDAMVKESASVVDKRKVANMIAAVAKNPDTL
ncbi:MAG: hypothetical protein A3C15_01690 [Candidatus Magasanikbacteria bacterium RIFCSPHIGHO2_02_FULL_50_9b]|uniref:Uncharacterized protein n=1 Tax=Candidatus Magasanikbacteria bacterium RIFCSPHIGHO2_02_FULL_50_9b TaxID=1798682 RepID=A0A1F6M8C8_9BACT|nr:MAG: hypothetical protein A3C15_01690 [Candidatus Magasanikbacteria bacterium RIFCSPHIGHO2_02_FULL_50_9b]